MKFSHHIVFCILFYLFKSICAATITGQVVDDQNHPLANANVKILTKEIGTTTNTNGEFTLNSSHIDDSDTLIISFVGYRPRHFNAANYKKRQPQKIVMHTVALAMPEIRIAAERLQRDKQLFAIEPSNRFLSFQTIKNQPFALLHDPVKEIQKLVGITSTNEIASRFNVRGGESDQNLFLLDGVPIYHPQHFLGLFSTLSNNLIDQMLISMGGFSARYGNRLSSVQDIRTPRAIQKIARVDIGLASADALVARKIRKNMGLLVSARSSYYDMISRLVEQSYPVHFYDLYGKLEWKPGPRQLFAISAYQTADAQDIEKSNNGILYSDSDNEKLGIKIIETDKLDVKNRFLSLKWELVLNDFWQIGLQGFVSTYANSFDKSFKADIPCSIPFKFEQDRQAVEKKLDERNENFKADIGNKLEDYTLLFSSSYQHGTTLMLNTGLQLTRHQFDYGWQGMVKFWDPFVNLFFDHAPEDSFTFLATQDQASGYLEGYWQPDASWQFRAGVRVNKWDFSNRIFFEPRLNTKYSPLRYFSLLAAWGQFYQGLDTCLEEGLIGFLELYFPSRVFQHPSKADHFIAGIEFELSSSATGSLTGYHKSFSHLLKISDTDERFQAATGQAYGFEIDLNMTIGKTRHSLGYAWSHSHRRFANLSYDTNFDQRHRLQYSLSLPLGKGWNFTGYWIFHTGQPYDPGRYLALYRGVDYIPYFNDRIYGVYGIHEIDAPPGRIRYPHYHRLDASVNKKTHWLSQDWTLYAAIRNIYNRKNVLYYRNIDYQTSSNDEWVDPNIDREPFYIPLLPTLGCTIEF